mmetsp:Transcript_22716/g.46637  ORF Transcript_22716/g.46637 Transcript_22716/m.46637 type:complete len:656 (+) Transcript_22716:299-2266(+)
MLLSDVVVSDEDSGHLQFASSGKPSDRPKTSPFVTAPILTVDLMKEILLFYGEGEMANNYDLVKEMIWAAAGSLGREDDSKGEDRSLPFVRLDECAFLRALIHDVQEYDIHVENRDSTNYFDVFQTLYSTKKSDDIVTRLTMEMDVTRRSKDCDNESSSENAPNKSGKCTSLVCCRKEKDKSFAKESSKEGSAVRPVERIFTFPSIDYTCDSFRNRSFVVVLWVTFIVAYFAYLYGNSSERKICGYTETHFGCIIGQGLYRWIEVILELSILGTSFLWLSSLGNTIYPTHPFYILIGIACIAVFTILPFFHELRVGNYVSTEKQNNGRMSLYFLSMIGGCVLIFLKLIGLLDSLIPIQFLMDHIRVGKMILSSNVRSEAKIKRAAAFKLNRMVKNAMDVHSLTDTLGDSRCGTNSTTSAANGSEFGKALLHFAKLSDKTVSDGGWGWAWRSIWNGQIYDNEGIWLSTRIIAGNLSKLIICLIFPIFGYIFLNGDLYQTYVQQLDKSEQWRMIVPATIGIILGFFAATNLALTLLPSTIRTVLQFRYGCIGSLNDKVFLDYRLAVEQQSLIFGSIFWGALYTSILVAFFFGGVLLFLMHPITSTAALALLASLLGISITALFKIGILLCFRSYFYAAFYRKKPAHANFVGIMLEVT